MANELKLDAVTLPPDLVWQDEFTHTPIEQSISYTLSGAMVVDQAVKQAGRPITLGGADDQAWVKRSVLLALYAKAQSGSPMTLTLPDGRTFQVVWRHQDRAIDADPIGNVSPPTSDTPYRVTLRLMEV